MTEKNKELTPFQLEFKVNDEFYSGKQIRDAIVKHFPVENHYEGQRYRLIGDSRWLSPEFIESAIPDQEKAFDIEKRMGMKIQNRDGYSKLIHLHEPDCEGRPAMTKFGLTDLGYICMEQIPVSQIGDVER